MGVVSKVRPSCQQTVVVDREYGTSDERMW
jgi:hypothetical protein